MLTRLIILVFLLSSAFGGQAQKTIDKYGALTRSDPSKKNIYLIFTGHDFYEGFEYVIQTLKRKEIKASFFLTGDFVRNHASLVMELKSNGHFIGAHSDKHLLYCDWIKRDSLLYAKATIKEDIINNLTELSTLGIYPKYFMPPYEWYNKEVVEIASSLGQKTVNFSRGTRSNADYTTPSMKNYISSQEILESIYEYEEEHGLNGFHLLIHPGTSAERTDKLWKHLDVIITRMKQLGYSFDRF